MLDVRKLSVILPVVSYQCRHWNHYCIKHWGRHSDPRRFRCQNLRGHPAPEVGGACFGTADGGEHLPLTPQRTRSRRHLRQQESLRCLLRPVSSGWSTTGALRTGQRAPEQARRWGTPGYRRAVWVETGEPCLAGCPPTCSAPSCESCSGTTINSLLVAQ